MKRVTYALGVLLVLIGIASVAFGLPEVQLESGWTAVISGTVAASAGCVIFVLGALLGRLDALYAIVAGATVAAPGRTAEAAVGQAPESSEPATAPLDDEDVSENARAPTEDDGVELLPEPPLREPLPVVSREVHSLDPMPQPITLPPNEPVAPARKRPNFLASFLSRRAAQREEDLSRLFEPTIAPEPVAHGPDDLDHEAPHAPEPHHGHPDAKPHETDPFEADLLRPTYVEDLPPDHAATDHSETAATEDAEGGLDPAQPTPDHPLRPSVVGRYTAGSASYVMYSNGMIEVETASGTHQFNSMQELKTFIENQEAARV